MKTKKTILLIVFGGIIILNIFSQNTPQLLLEKIKTSNETEKFNLYIELAKYYSEITPGEALKYANKSLEISKKIKIDNTSSLKLNDVFGEIYYYQEDYNKSIFYYQQELDMQIKNNLTKDALETSNNLALIYIRIKNYKKSVDYYLSSLNLAEKINDKKKQAEIYLGLSDVFFKMKKYEQAYENFKKYTDVLDLTNNLNILSSKYNKLQNEKKISEKKLKQLSVDTAKKSEVIKNLAIDNKEKSNTISEQSEKIQLQNKLLKEERKRLILFISFLIILSVLFVFLYKMYSQIRKANIILSEQKDKIEKQNKEITVKNQEITDSILYAKRIQKAILPQTDYIKKIVDNYFLLWKPRDIVSGDFYWIAEKNDVIIAVAADCTGHGVPGAFMSILGVTLFNEIVLNKSITKPDEILNLLRMEIIRLLHQDIETQSTRDGMDVSVIVIDKKKNIMLSAAANNAIYLLRNNEIQTIIPDKMPIAVFYKMDNFNCNITNLEKGDIIYLSSDGYKDQFGGSMGKRFMSSKFKKILIEISNEKIEHQKELLEKQLTEWKGSNPQTDDILVMGFKI